MVLPPRKPATKEEKDRAEQILKQADTILKKVDEAYIFTASGQQAREFPKFQGSEMKMGPLLGIGGFSGVFEITEIILKQKAEEVKEEKPDSPCEGEGPFIENTTKPTADEDHYDIANARDIMANRCIRFGSSRYALKLLRPDLNELERVRGMLDLAIEIKLLSILWHPNIGT